MNRRIVGIGILLVFLVATLGFAKTDIFEGEGARISPLYNSTISADTPCWVRHGWRGDYYPRMQPEIKDETGNQTFVNAGKMTFRLFIGDVEVKLRSSHIVIPGDEPGTSTRHWQYYIQFEAYHFEPGEYELRGVWDMKNPRSRELYTYQGGTLPYVRVATLTVEP